MYYRSLVKLVLCNCPKESLRRTFARKLRVVFCSGNNPLITSVDTNNQHWFLSKFLNCNVQAHNTGSKLCSFLPKYRPAQHTIQLKITKFVIEVAALQLDQDITPLSTRSRLVRLIGPQKNRLSRLESAKKTKPVRYSTKGLRTFP